MRNVGLWLGGLVVLVGSFFITNWILSRSAGFDWKFTDEKSLGVAAKAAGFRTSKDLAGHVDGIIRINAGQVRANGFAVDLTGDGSPIILNAFIDGRNIATFRTDGPRDDISTGIKTNPNYSPDAAKNTQFVSSFSCNVGDKILLVATTVRKTYLLVAPAPLVCP